MKFDLSSILGVIGKCVGGLILVAIVLLSVVGFDGPGAQQWFAEHPVVHFFYKLIHFID